MLNKKYFNTITLLYGLKEWKRRNILVTESQQDLSEQESIDSD